MNFQGRGGDELGAMYAHSLERSMQAGSTSRGTMPVLTTCRVGVSVLLLIGIAVLAIVQPGRAC